MVDILCHRGCWRRRSEQNTVIAFKRAFSLNLGIETDIRDYRGEIVISHGIANKNNVKLETLFSLYNEYRQKGALALNIKADGLQNELQVLLRKFNIKNYFVFDMSFPEQLMYSRCGFNVFARLSEYERQPLLYSTAKGLWIDEFDRHWINPGVIKKYTQQGKPVCIVSPELHHRRFQDAWEEYRKIEKKLKIKKLLLCTDYSEKAKEFFDE